MRILVVQETDWIERNPILHHRMLESLSMCGHAIVVIDYDTLWGQKGRWPLLQGRREISDCHKFFDESCIRLIRPPMVRLPGLGRPSWLVANVFELGRQLRGFRPDVVIAYSISNAYIAQKLARAYGVPFVLHMLDALHTLAEPQSLWPIARAVERRVVRAADSVIVVNKALRAYAEAFGASPSRTFVIPMGADHKGLPEDLREATRASLGYHDGDTVMLFMGWLYTFSGLREVISEMGRRRNDLNGLKLLVVGDGDVYQDLSRLRVQLGLEEHVTLTGKRPVSEMRVYLAASDVSLLPALATRTMEHIVPAKVLESLEVGCPVIATRLPGLVAEFGAMPGIVYIERPEEAIEEAIEFACIMTADQVQSLRRSSSAFMRKRGSWDAVTAQFSDVLELTASRCRNGGKETSRSDALRTS